MRWLISTPTIGFDSIDGSLPPAIDVIEDFMAEYDNQIPWLYPAVYPYKRSDPIAVFLATKFYAETMYPGEVEVRYEGFEIPEPESDAPADALF